MKKFLIVFALLATTCLYWCWVSVTTTTTEKWKVVPTHSKDNIVNVVDNTSEESTTTTTEEENDTVEFDVSDFM